MAQETSGTISKTILKNEMLPMLLNEQKRADRAYAYEEQAKRKAAELAAKKAAEDSKFVPKFESSSGDLFGHITKANADNRIKGALDIYRDPSSPQQTKMLTAYEANRMNMDDADLDKQLTAKIYKSAEDISKNRFRKVGTDYISNWGKNQQNYATPEQFAKEALSDPSLIDFDAIGKTAKEYKTSDYTYRDKGGNQKVVKMSPLFDYKFEKDPILGTEVPVVTGVNGAEAQKLIESNSDIQDAFNVWVGNRSKEYKDNRTFIDPVTGSPTMIRPDLAEDQAAKEFMEQSFGKYGKIEYGKQFAMPKKSGSGSGKQSVQITTPAKTSSHSLPYEIAGTKQNYVVDVGTDKDVQHTYDRDYNLSAGLKIRPIGSYDDIEEWEKKLIEKKSDGTYASRGRIKYGSAKDTKLYWATKDVEIPDSRGNIITIRKGRELSPENAIYLKNKAKKDKTSAPYVFENGYEITGQMELYDPTDDTNKRQEIHFFIPKKYASSIDTHVKMQEAKYKSKASETEEDEEKVDF